MSTNPTHSRILLVEDSQSTRMMARAAIERLGLEVVEAATGAEALEHFARQSIDLVLLDVGLPDRDGYEVARCIRESESDTEVPIIMVTGQDDVESVKRAFAAGATDFASKPVSWLILGQRLLFALESARRQREILAQREELAETQRLASIGGWTYRLADERLELSGNAQQILDLPSESEEFDVVMARIPEHERDRFRATIERGLETAQAVEIKHLWLDSRGDERVLYTHARWIRPPGSGELYIQGLSQDITIREQAEERVRYLSQHDKLTGLKNQEFFRESLAMTFAQQRRAGGHHALLLVNLDNFSRINDLHGREAGDAVLRASAERLAGAVRVTDMVTAGTPISATIARVGSDEFSVIIADMQTPADIARVAVRIVRSLHDPILVGEEEFIVTARIGIAIAPEDGTELRTLMANADAANRHARDSGGNGYEFYRKSMNDTARHRLGLEHEFRQALLAKQVIPHYQPRVDMRTGVVVGAEALARWHHETRGWVSPQEFVQLAEESGLTLEFGRSIIASVTGQMRRWRLAGYDLVPISINISPTLLIDERFPQLMSELMDANGIDPSLIEVEITETVLIRREEDAAVALGKLKALGLTIALDDFGTGYSALSHLRQFPVDVIKIDRSFVDALVDEKGRAIVRGVISIAHAMGMRVVAEGVENLEQRAFLAQEGCDEEQGFLFSRPVPAEKIKELFWPISVDPILAALTSEDEA